MSELRQPNHITPTSLKSFFNVFLLIYSNFSRQTKYTIIQQKFFKPSLQIVWFLEIFNTYFFFEFMIQIDKIDQMQS